MVQEDSQEIIQNHHGMISESLLLLAEIQLITLSVQNLQLALVLNV